MATLSDYGRDRAIADATARLLPVDVTSWTSIATSVAFGPFEPGDTVTIVNDGPAHVNAGAANDTEAVATNPQLPAGEHDFVVPDGCHYVALLGASGSESGCVFKSS